MTETIRSQIFVGTSGYSYPEWKEIFYPPKLPSKDYLRFYSESFRTTEINNTFYRLPSPSLAEGWKNQVSGEFRFSVKLSKKITHDKRLRAVDSEMEVFSRGIEAIRSALACVLVQLSPYFRKDLVLLEEFVAQYCPLFPMAFEFRHESWASDDVRRFLADRQLALVLAETDEEPGMRLATGPYLYARLRKTEYSEEELVSWAGWFQEQARTAYVYFKHDVKAPVIARQFIELLQATSSR